MMTKTDSSIFTEFAQIAKRIFTRKNLQSFFMGKWYPIWIFVSVFLSYSRGIEIYLAIFDLLLISLAMFVCDTLRPIIPILITFLYRISFSHAPGLPVFSKYLFEGARPWLVLAAFGVFLGALVHFIVRNRIYRGFTPKSAPLFISLAAFSSAILLNGVGSDKWIWRNIPFSLLEVLCFALVFWLLYYGLRKEKPDELCRYFVYVSAVAAVLLIAQLILVYSTRENIISPGGNINKEAIYFGWGIHNTVGAALSFLIPVCFLGCIKEKSYKSYIYFAIGIMTYIAAVFTLSRNAIIVSTVATVVSVIVCCFKGHNKRIYRYTAPSILAFIAVFMYIYGDKIEALLKGPIDAGLNNNGRYYLWDMAESLFKEYPLFGAGFFSFDRDPLATMVVSSFTPVLAHNTVLTLLACTGSVGLVSYLVYRGASLIPFLTKPRVEKMMFVVACGAMVGGSLIDNFIFWFAPTFMYNIMIAIAFMYRDEEKLSEAPKIRLRFATRVKMLIERVKAFRISAYKNKLLRIKEKLVAFFMGKWFPVYVAVSVFISHVHGLEFELAIIDLLMLAAAIIMCGSMRPMLPMLIMFLYRLSREHSSDPKSGGNGYIFEGYMPWVVIACFGIVILAVIHHLVKNRAYKDFVSSKTPLLLPLTLLGSAFLLAGIFSNGWSISDLRFGALEMLCFAIVFWILYYGLKKENADELCDYFVYITAICGVMLLAQLAHIYKANPNVVINGVINKYQILVGWGMSNTFGSALSVIPTVCLVGAVRNKKWHSYLYFALSIATMIGTILTLSRSAILAGTILYGVALVIVCFKGEHRRVYRVLIPILTVAALLILCIYKQDLEIIFGRMIDKGFDDSNRFEIYKRSWKRFLSAPLFGVGFYSASEYKHLKSAFVPGLAHNTVMQVMSSMGLFGICSYAYYRVSSLIPFLRKPTTTKMLFLITEAILVGESLLDNFILWFAPTFSYNIMIVLAFMLLEAQEMTAEPETPVIREL